MTTIAHSYLDGTFENAADASRTPTTTCDVVEANAPCGHPLCDRCELARLSAAMHAAGSTALDAEDALDATTARDRRANTMRHEAAVDRYVRARAAYVAALDA